MTRFARSKGSKASNERVTEEATPWSELKQQLLEKNKEIEENQKRKEAIEKRTANYKAFLEEKEKDSGKNSSWADFPDSQDTSTNGKSKKVKHSATIKPHKQKNVKTPSEQEENNNLNHNLVSNSMESESDEPPEEQSSKIEIVEPVVSKKKKVKPNKLLKITLEVGSKVKNRNQEEDGKTTKKRKAIDNVEGKQKKFKKVKNNEGSTKNEKKLEETKQKKKIVKENLTEKDLKKIEKKKQKRLKQVEKKKQVKAALKAQKQKEEMDARENGETKTDVENEGGTTNQFKSFEKSVNGTPNKPFNMLKKLMENRRKVRDKEEHPRKKPLLPHKMFINGKELEIDYVDGFPVKKEDAVRLKKLRKEMISKGLPRSEINIALKLERRKAEKAFAREKKKVCFHCRLSGHNLSECPSLDKNEVAQTAASGICFKCGSTEHTHFECKVIRGQEFKYATCFICKEQGHIARQCPDNARGLYPKGGACKVCGDVTHLKKDCPTYQAQQQKQEENMRVETLGGSNPDVLEEKFVGGGGSQNKKKANKIIKF